MNDRQREVQLSMLQDEQEYIRILKETFRQASQDCENKIRELSARTDLENIQSIVYQQQYQMTIKKQIDEALMNLQNNEYSSMNDYLENCYTNSFTGTLYDLHGQGVPVLFPIDQSQVAKAVQLDSAISVGLYTRLGEDVLKLKDNIRSQVSRGIASGSTWNQTATEIAMGMRSPFNKAYNNAVRIARTEGHRIQNQAQTDTLKKAKSKGADVVKQWDSTLDDVTRDTHKQLDGQIREIDQPFEVNGKTAMQPGGFGDPAEDCNCRCCMLQRAKWALDESELRELESRAEYFGLDKADSFEDFKKKYLNASKNGGIIKSIDVDDYELYTYGKNIQSEVNNVILETMKQRENDGGFVISEISTEVRSTATHGTAVLQIEPMQNGLLRLNINADFLSGKTLQEIDDIFTNSNNTVVNSLKEAIIHESGHAISIKGKTTSEIARLYDELGKIHLDGVSDIALNDGAECLAELEVLRFRGADVSQELSDFYEKYMGRVYK